MDEQAKGLAAAVRGFAQDPHKATYEACVTALDKGDIAERKVQERRDWQALTNDYLWFSRMFGWTQAKMLVQDFGVLSLKGTQPSQWPAIREALAQSPATLAARREARKPQQAVSAELRAEHAPKLAEALRAFVAKRTYQTVVQAAATLDRYDNAVKAEREANTQRNKPVGGSYLAAMAPAKGCNCETCRDERRRGLRLDDSTY